MELRKPRAGPVTSATRPFKSKLGNPIMVRSFVSSVLFWGSCSPPVGRRGEWPQSEAVIKRYGDGRVTAAGCPPRQTLLGRRVWPMPGRFIAETCTCSRTPNVEKESGDEIGLQHRLEGKGRPASHRPHRACPGRGRCGHLGPPCRGAGWVTHGLGGLGDRGDL